MPCDEGGAIGRLARRGGRHRNTSVHDRSDPSAREAPSADARSMPSAGRFPVSYTPRPRPHRIFSLNSGVGAR